MTYNRPGAGTHVVNDSGGTLAHNQPAKLQNYVGVVVKQKATKWSDAYSASTVIATSEKCWMITKGIVQVPFVTGFTKGDAIYIDSGNLLTKTVGANTKFGRVIEVTGDGRSVPSGQVRISLDAKDSF